MMVPVATQAMTVYEAMMTYNGIRGNEVYNGTKSMVVGYDGTKIQWEATMVHNRMVKATMVHNRMVEAMTAPKAVNDTMVQMI